MSSAIDPAAVCESHGRSTLDYLMQVGFVKAEVGSGGNVLAPVLRDGRPMSQGKSAWNLFVAMRDTPGYL